MALCEAIFSIMTIYIYKKYETKDSVENEQKDEGDLDFIETGINCTIELRDYVSRIIHKHYHKDYYDMDNLKLFHDVFHLDEYLKNKFDEIINKPEKKIFLLMKLNC